MLSKNQLFKKYLKQQNDLMKKSDPKFTLHGNSEFIAKCRTDWKAMTENERKVYCNECEPKSVGKPIDPLVEDNQNAKYEEVFEQKVIDLLIKYKSKDELMKTKFFLMSSNILCIIGDTYPPLEIGFVEYTIEDGIQKTFHSFIKSDEIPIGYAYSAVTNSQNEHKIPVKDFVLASDEFGFIGDQIRYILAESRATDQMINKFDNPMIVFSSAEQIKQNKGVLEWLSMKYKEVENTGLKDSFDWNIKVLDVTNLLFTIYAEMGVHRPMALCKSEMNTSIFDYSPDTDCPYHEREQCIVCALGVAKRMAYSLSQCLYRVFRFKVLSTHFPKMEFDHKYSYLEFFDNNSMEKLKIEDIGDTQHTNDDNDSRREHKGLSGKCKTLGIGRAKSQ